MMDMPKSPKIRLLSLLVTDVFFSFSHSSRAQTMSFIKFWPIPSNDCCQSIQMKGKAPSTRAKLSPQQGSVSSWTWRQFPPITDRQCQLTPLGGRIGGLPSSPPSTSTTSFSISDSDRRFCLIVVGTIILVSSFSCLRNFFFKCLLWWCLACLCTGYLMYAIEAACVLIDEGWVELENTWTHGGGQRDRSTQTP